MKMRVFRRLYLKRTYVCFRHAWSKVEDLHKRKEQVPVTSHKSQDSDDEDSDADVEQLQDMLDWRTKKAWNV